MSALYKAAEWLNLSKEQTKALVHHWYLAGLLEQDYLTATLEHLKVPSPHIEVILSLTENFDPTHFCENFYPEDERFALTALALLEYFQQSHFSKGTHKEVSMAIRTSYCSDYEREILDLATQFDLLEPKSQSNADITLMIGGRVWTNQTYLKQYTENPEKLNVLYIFLSTRQLTADENLTAEKLNTEFNLEQQCDYFTYLRNNFLTNYCAQFNIPYTNTLTEGLAFFERTEAFKSLRPNTQIEYVYTNTPNSDDFYPAAIQHASSNNYLANERASIAVSSIQPYVGTYGNKVQYYADSQQPGISVSAYGPSGSTKAEILVQALAMNIDSLYPFAAKKALAATGIHAIPLGALRRNSRDSFSAQLPQSYLEYMDEIAQTPTLRV